MSKLSELPADVMYHIAMHLPTVNALVNLARTCRRMSETILRENSMIFQAFVRSRFPSIQTKPYWNDAARALSSRSRALDRKGIIGRFVTPPRSTIKIGCPEFARADNPTLGYRPVIDSYEIWNGESWADRKEVLAWGAGNQLVLRIKQTGVRPQDVWIQFNEDDQATTFDDICSLHLLSHEEEYQQDGKEHLILGRVRGDCVHLAICVSSGTYEYKHTFLNNDLRLKKTDLSNDDDRTLMAHFDNGTLALYHTATEDHEVKPFVTLGPESGSPQYTKLLSSSMLAACSGRMKDTLQILRIGPDGAVPYRTISADNLDIEHTSRVNIGCIEPLNKQPFSGSPGEVFLTAWNDSTIRLHDLRSPKSYELAYQDEADVNPIYSLQAFGHNNFLAGAGSEALVTVFDFRMCNTYNYLDAKIRSSQSQKQNAAKKKTESKIPTSLGSGFSVFLSTRPPPPFGQPIPRHRTDVYRGPVYSMSTPSQSSPTVYAGIEDGIVRLDFASTDDLMGSQSAWFEHNLALDINMDFGDCADSNREAMNLAGFERPDDCDSATTSALRHQQAFASCAPVNGRSEVVTDWDQRWMPLEASGAWRRQD